MGGPMKLAIAIATGVLTMTSTVDAAPRPAVEHYGNPTLNGAAAALLRSGSGR